MKPNEQTKKTRQETIQELQRKIETLEASQIHRLHFASRDIDRCLVDKMKGSAVMLTIKSVTGKVIVDSVMISGGLSADTIAAFKNDLKRAFAYDTEMKP